MRNTLLVSFDDEDLSDEEFCMLYDLNKSSNDYSYWNEDRFNLDSLDDVEAQPQC